jgi:hypothetical protein
VCRCCLLFLRRTVYPRFAIAVTCWRAQVNVHQEENDKQLARRTHVDAPVCVLLLLTQILKEKHATNMNSRGMMEGLGGPVNVDPYDLGGIDPSLEDCCRREVIRHDVFTASHL